MSWQDKVKQLMKDQNLNQKQLSKKRKRKEKGHKH